MRAAICALKSAAFHIREQAVYGMVEAEMLKAGQDLRDADPLDVMQVGRYMGELLHLAGHGTPARLWPEPPPRPTVEAAPSEVTEMVNLLGEAMESRGAEGLGGLPSSSWRERVRALLDSLAARATDVDNDSRKAGDP